MKLGIYAFGAGRHPQKYNRLPTQPPRSFGRGQARPALSRFRNRRGARSSWISDWVSVHQWETYASICGGVSAPCINHGPLAASGDSAYKPVIEETIGYHDCFSWPVQHAATMGQKREGDKYPKTWDSNCGSYPGRIYSQYQNTKISYSSRTCMSFHFGINGKIRSQLLV